MIALGTVLRSVSTDSKYFLVTSHLCSILNGISGVIIMAAPPAISAAWFAPGERTTATSINQVMNNAGNAVSFLVGPYVVPDNFANMSDFTRDTPTAAGVRKDIQWYVVGQAGVACAIFLVILAYFPSKPPTPPSPSSETARTGTRFTNFKLFFLQNYSLLV